MSHAQAEPNKGVEIVKKDNAFYLEVNGHRLDQPIHHEYLANERAWFLRNNLELLIRALHPNPEPHK